MVLGTSLESPGSTAKAMPNSSIRTDTSISKSDRPAPRPPVYYKAITERPLFSPSRRPEAKSVSAPKPLDSVEPTAVSEQGTPAFVLKGIMVMGDISSALIATQDAPAVWVTTGANVAGWKLQDVDSEAVDLSLGSNTVHVELYPK